MAATAVADELKRQNTLRIGDVAPDFTAATQDADAFNWYKYIEGSWAILFSHPKDFTPVCTTEIARVAQLKAEWAKRGTKVAVVSVDGPKEHRAWIEDINKYGKTTVDFPIVADPKKDVAVKYGMLNQEHLDDQTGLPLTVRAVYIIGPDKKIKLIIVYPASTGRNFDEIIRVLDSVQLTANKAVATPADWKHGDDVFLLPSVSEADAKAKFPSHKTDLASCKIRSAKFADVQ